jgi:hypothetical protein
LLIYRIQYKTRVTVTKLAREVMRTVPDTTDGSLSYRVATMAALTAVGTADSRMPTWRARPVIPNGMTYSAAKSGATTKLSRLAHPITFQFSWLKVRVAS